MNQMMQIRIEKVTLNVGAGTDQNKLEKGISLLRSVSGLTPVKTFTKKRIPTWGIRPGLPIGCKITIRKKQADELLARLLEAKSKALRESQFDAQGNISFGIHEYIDVPGVKYDPKIGVMGFEICITLQRPGYRVKRRTLKRNKISHKHKISKEDAIAFMKKAYNITVGEN
jgi:large subunit ribosomal protein L5